MRKKHGSVPKIHTCSGPDSHNEQDTGTQGAITNGTPVLPPQVRTTPHDGGPAEQQKADGWLAAARRAAATMASAPSGQTAAAMTSGRTLLPQGPRPRPHSRGEDKQKAVESEVSPRAAPAISLAEKPLPAATAEGGTGSGAKAARAGEPDTRQLPAPRTANALPLITEGRSGLLPARRPTPTRRTPLPRMMNILEAEGGAEAAARLASPHPEAGGHCLG
jgi:hypothetical protein